ncbi:MAG: L-2-hydroxyglutarate oxidase [Bacteroidetes bacterium]|jgi:L-2-hydroxyglutarate oxidase|nr:L-2-hydroxyglutarate oxidase [Bacteroidota bacterium]
MPTYDIAIIGGGIVGLATAYRLTQSHPDRSVVVIEKEDRVAFHQTGRNSGVVHSGVFYTPGSLKAENCREGKRALVEFCEREGVDVDMCGKVVVAVTEEEIPELNRIEEKGRLNQVEARRIGPDELQEIEPHTRGVAALHVPGAGIVDYTGMTEALARCATRHGYDLKTNAAVTNLHTESTHVTVQTTAGDVSARHVVNCAGLYADKIAEMSGQTPAAKVVPFRGEYYELVPERRHLCRNLIYPVPDPAFPFLGVHFTRMVDGSVECGPSAVLAFAREGYKFWDVNWPELIDTVTYPGFLKLSMKHWQKGVHELLQSLSKKVYVKAAQHLVPEVTAEDFVPSPSGVRAQALRPNGELVDDFLIQETDRVVNVINAASPAATASLNIGRLIVENYLDRRLSTTQVRAA